MAVIYKAELEQKFGLPVYCYWNNVPEHMITRTSAKREKIAIPPDAEADAIKGGGLANGGRVYKLYDKRKYTGEPMPEPEPVPIAEQGALFQQEEH